jgi:hypothetical protein
VCVVLRDDLRSELDPGRFTAAREAGRDWLSLSAPGGRSHGWCKACVRVIRVAGSLAKSLSIKSMAKSSVVNNRTDRLPKDCSPVALIPISLNNSRSKSSVYLLCTLV